ncbi:MAG: M48 family metallopeptidase, partial [Melioribacteraceae bacterium]|nr:M48 family metallopeptidase [Melioribacteraceae bacterium]
MTINKSKRYNNIKLAFGIGKGVLSFILILLFVLLGYSSELLAELKSVTENNYLLLLLFTIVIGVVSSIIFAPVNYYVDFYLEHKYDLSNQTFWKWITENFKETLVGSVIGLPILILFFWVLNLFGQLWWLPFALAMFVISVVLAKLVPVIILPIFYKITPIDNEELKARIVRLADNAGMKVENVFKFDMSKNTKKANAAFTGLGKTKRIILGDTLLENYSEDEIETVIAHELGHYKHNHIVKNIIISTIFSFATFFLIAQFYSISINWFGFESIQQIDALPVLV